MTSENAQETLGQWRAAAEVAAWRGRAILAEVRRIDNKALSKVPGDTLLDQVEQIAAAILARPVMEKFRGATTWRRSDPLLCYLVLMAALDDFAVDAWFRKAENLQ